MVQVIPESAAWDRECKMQGDGKRKPTASGTGGNFLTERIPEP